MKRKGFLITFEGPEGSGKTTLIRAALDYLQSEGDCYSFFREPGGTVISEKIRDLLLDAAHSGMNLECELFLYFAARAQLVSEKILPRLRRGEIVVLDRYHDSTAAYQGYAGGFPLKKLEEMGRATKQGVEPDLTILLDVPVERGLKRSGRKDRIEKKSLPFHRRVRRGFLALAKKEPRRFVILKDEREIAVKRRKLLGILEERLKSYGGRTKKPH